MGTADFQHILEFLALLIEGICQVFQGNNKLFGAHQSADTDGCRNNIVSGLRHIGMVIRADIIIIAARTAENFQSTVADYFVRIHIEGCSCTALNRIGRELVVQLAADDIIAGLHHSITDFFIQKTDFHIGQGRSFFYHTQGFDKKRIGSITCNLKVFHGTHGLYTIISIIRNF